MKIEERILEVQELTNNYFKTAELLDLTYEEVRAVYEENEEEVEGLKNENK